MNKQKRIMILLPTGMTVRNMLSTNVVKEILKYKNIQIVCCTRNPNKYKLYFKNENIEFITFYNKSKFNLTRLLLLILSNRFYCLKTNLSREILKKGPISQSFYNKFSLILSYPFPKSKKLYNLIFKIMEKTYNPIKEIIYQFDKYEPDLIFATHIVTRNEFDYIITAKKKSVPILGMVKSFDNLTTKGFLPYLPDFCILWNDVMKNELATMYNYDNKQAFITGIPQFDIYKEKPKISNKQFLQNFNFSDKRKVILFSTNHKDLSPDDVKTVKFISSNLNKLNASLLVRLHPNDNIERYRNLNLQNVFIHAPGISDGNSADDRLGHIYFLEDLRDNIYYSDVTINTASTMTLDASALDKPIINIAFDFDKKGYFKSVRRYYDQIHYKEIIKSNSTSLAKNPSEMITLLSKYLENPNIKKEERNRMNHILLAGNKGNASKNIAKTVNKVLNRI